MPESLSHPALPLSRRHLLVAASSAAALLGPARPAAAQTPGELSVTEALRARRSTRAFADRPIKPALLAELLWAAFGVNRPETGLRTAPSWHGAMDVSVHVATAEGVFSFDPVTNAVVPSLRDDIRSQLSTQPFVATAPACLILISDLQTLKAAETDAQKQLWATVDAAIVAENVYLFAAARGLGTCLVGGLDRGSVTRHLGLAPHEYPTFVQPVGWPA